MQHEEADSTLSGYGSLGVVHNDKCHTITAFPLPASSDRIAASPAVWLAVPGNDIPSTLAASPLLKDMSRRGSR